MDQIDRRGKNNSKDLRGSPDYRELSHFPVDPREVERPQNFPAYEAPHKSRGCLNPPASTSDPLVVSAVHQNDSGREKMETQMGTQLTPKRPLSQNQDVAQAEQ